MSLVDQHTSSIAYLTSHGPSPSARITTRLLFDHRSAPHKYHSAATEVRPIGSDTPPVTVHRDVSTRFGQRLKQLRTDRNLTQVRMAREFGLDRSYISDVERGRKSVSLPTMEIIALGLKLSLAELLSGI
jgi:DNA-binding XRE family transcriptional regulator